MAPRRREATKNILGPECSFLLASPAPSLLPGAWGKQLGLLGARKGKQLRLLGAWKVVVLEKH